MSGSVRDCLPQLIANRAAERPDAIAVVAPPLTITYRQLDRAANHLAARLSAHGARAERLVAIYGQVGAEAVLAMLAIMKSGGAFLPLDPGDPIARTERLLGLAEPVALVTTSEWAERAGEFGRPVIVIGSQDLAASGDPPGLEGQPTDLAYVLFTSGSTGQPKGVMVEQHSLVNYCRWVATENRVAGRVAPLPTVTRFTFDAAIQQWIAPLFRGDAVWVVPREARTDPERLLATLRARPGAGLHCVPALWEEIVLLLEQQRDQELPLACLFLGGEVVRPDLWERTRRLLPGLAMANVYGPTETTVQATGGFQQPGATLSVGRPALGVTIEVLGDDGRRIAPGEIGEVWIGGAGVARGYLADPVTTAERFRDGAEFGLAPGRLYRTGDAGALLPDGSLRIIGRLDDQLKIRGFRIEPGEVEAALTAHPGVAACAMVVPREGPYAGLACAVVSMTPSFAAGDPDRAGRLLAELPGHAATLLPPYMVPGQWSVLASLPRTASGKLNRAEIAASFAASRRTGRPLVTDTERTVAGVWSEILGREVTSADDDIFDLGGHSLTVNRIAARLRRVLGMADALQLMFTLRTVGAVARVHDARGAGVAEVPAAAGQEQNDADGPAPLSLQQESIWASEQVLADTPFNHMLLPVQIYGPVDVAALAAAMSTVVAAQPSLRVRVELTGEVPRQRLADPAPVPLPVRDLRDPDREHRNGQAFAAARALFAAPLDLRTGPVLRAELLRLDEAEWVLLICIHHLVCDGVSLGIILAELVTAYASLSSGNAPDAGRPASAAAPSALAYARDQRRRLSSGELAADLAYWRHKLSTPISPLPFLPPAGRGPDSFRAGAVSARYGAARVRRLAGFARQAGATQFMSLAAALCGLLHLRSGISPIRLGTLTAARPTDELSGVVGLFAGTLVLQVEVATTICYRDLVGAMRSELLDSYLHQQVPLELVLAGAPGLDPDRLFHVGLTWEPERRPLVAGPTRFEPYQHTEDGTWLPVVASSVDLSVGFSARGEDLLGTVEYNEAVLSREGGQTLLADLYELTDRLLAEPDRPLDLIAAGLGPAVLAERLSDDRR